MEHLYERPGVAVRLQETSGARLANLTRRCGGTPSCCTLPLPGHWREYWGERQHASSCMVVFEAPTLNSRQLATGGRDPLVEDESDKATVIALREIADGLITPEVLARESEIEAEEELAATFETPIL